MKTFHRLSIPTNTHPLVKLLFIEMNAQQIGLLDMAERSGVSKNTIVCWKRRAIPNLANIDACFNVLGMKISAGSKRS